MADYIWHQQLRASTNDRRAIFDKDSHGVGGVHLCGVVEVRHGRLGGVDEHWETVGLLPSTGDCTMLVYCYKPTIVTWTISVSVVRDTRFIVGSRSFSHLAPKKTTTTMNGGFCHEYHWKNSDWIFVKSNIEDRCNYNLLSENKWCNHDTKIVISPIFKMAAATILDFEKIGYSWRFASSRSDK